MRGQKIKVKNLLGHYLAKDMGVHTLFDILGNYKTVKGRSTGVEKEIEYQFESTPFPIYGIHKKYTGCAKLLIRNSISSNNRKHIKKAEAIQIMEATILWLAGRICWKHGLKMRLGKEI